MMLYKFPQLDTEQFVELQAVRTIDSIAAEASSDEWSYEDAVGAGISARKHKRLRKTKGCRVRSAAYPASPMSLASSVARSLGESPSCSDLSSGSLSYDTDDTETCYSDHFCSGHSFS